MQSQSARSNSGFLSSLPSGATQRPWWDGHHSKRSWLPRKAQRPILAGARLHPYPGHRGEDRLLRGGATKGLEKWTPHIILRQHSSWAQAPCLSPIHFSRPDAGLPSSQSIMHIGSLPTDRTLVTALRRLHRHDVFCVSETPNLSETLIDLLLRRSLPGTWFWKTWTGVLRTRTSGAFCGNTAWWRR